MKLSPWALNCSHIGASLTDSLAVFTDILESPPWLENHVQTQLGTSNRGDAGANALGPLGDGLGLGLRVLSPITRFLSTEMPPWW